LSLHDYIITAYYQINTVMIFGFLTLLTSLTIAGVAAWFSIEGLMAIFSASALQIAIMAGTLEIGKLLTASWLYRYWNTAGLLIKTYLTVAVLVLMLITSMGIFGYLSKAHLDQAGVSGDAIAAVERIDGQISREENKISILQDRISGLSSGTGVDLTSSISQQESIRDGAWEQVQGDIEYNQQQITSVREQLTLDLQGVDTREEKIDVRLSALDTAVNDLRSKGVEVIETDAGGAFRRAETETIDYVAQANTLRDSQQAERAEIADQKQELKSQRQGLRDQANADIRTFQSAIDRYRAQAQNTIDNANAEINNLRGTNAQSQDDTLEQIDTYNNQIDELYNGIAVLKEEKFEAESIVRGLEKEVGPIKYVAQLIYGNDSADYLDQSVRLFILMLVFVFDPLAVILLIAANQTLMRYGINLENEGPDDDGDKSDSTDTSTTDASDNGGTIDRPRDDEVENSDTTQSGSTADDTVHLQQVGATGEDNSVLQDDQSVELNNSAMVMASSVAAESAALRNELEKIKKQLTERPKEVIVEKEPNIIINTPESIVKLEQQITDKLKGKEDGE
jgi:hypothetical protein